MIPLLGADPKNRVGRSRETLKPHEALVPSVQVWEKAESATAGQTRPGKGRRQERLQLRGDRSYVTGLAEVDGGQVKQKTEGGKDRYSG